MKALAEQTAKATSEISGQILQIQVSTGQAVTAIGGITGRNREINAVATSIAAAVEEQGAATQEIVRNVAQAAAGTGEVTSNIAGVAGAAEETGAAASQVPGAVAELSRRSEHLAAEIGRVLADVRAESAGDDRGGIARPHGHDRQPRSHRGFGWRILPSHGIYPP